MDNVAMTAPLTDAEYEPIRAALFDRRNGSATEAKQALADSLAAAGLMIVPRPVPKRRGAPANMNGCQSRLYGSWGVLAKCWLSHEDGDPDRHSNGYRSWTTAESEATRTRWRPEEPDPALCRMPDGRWSCVREGVTEPCGDCDGCRLIDAERRALEASGRVTD